jgi:hypothetical protein
VAGNLRRNRRGARKTRVLVTTRNRPLMSQNLGNRALLRCFRSEVMRCVIHASISSTLIDVSFIFLRWQQSNSSNLSPHSHLRDRLKLSSHPRRLQVSYQSPLDQYPRSKGLPHLNHPSWMCHHSRQRRSSRPSNNICVTALTNRCTMLNMSVWCPFLRTACKVCSRTLFGRDPSR